VWALGALWLFMGGVCCVLFGKLFSLSLWRRRSVRALEAWQR
jgi:hypothetical protein